MVAATSMGALTEMTVGSCSTEEALPWPANFGKLPVAPPFGSDADDGCIEFVARGGTVRHVIATPQNSAAPSRPCHSIVLHFQARAYRASARAIARRGTQVANLHFN